MSNHSDGENEEDEHSESNLIEEEEEEEQQEDYGQREYPNMHWQSGQLSGMSIFPHMSASPALVPEAASTMPPTTLLESSGNSNEQTAAYYRQLQQQYSHHHQQHHPQYSHDSNGQQYAHGDAQPVFNNVTYAMPNNMQYSNEQQYHSHENAEQQADDDDEPVFENAEQEQHYKEMYEHVLRQQLQLQAQQHQSHSEGDQEQHQAFYTSGHLGDEHEQGQQQHQQGVYPDVHHQQYAHSTYGQPEPYHSSSSSASAAPASSSSSSSMSLATSHNRSTFVDNNVSGSEAHGFSPSYQHHLDQQASFYYQLNSSQSGSGPSGGTYYNGASYASYYPPPENSILPPPKKKKKFTEEEKAERARKKAARIAARAAAVANGTVQGVKRRRTAIDPNGRAPRSAELRGQRRRETCAHDSCQILASFGVEGGRPCHCKKHKTADEVNVTHTKCVVEGCETGPSFGLPADAEGELRGKILHCMSHRGPGEINLKKAARLCQQDGCGTTACYGVTKTALHCSKHKQEGEHNVRSKKCSHEGCDKTPAYAVDKDSPAIFCGAHKGKDFVDKTKKYCFEPGCTTGASYGMERWRRTHCGKHKQPGQWLVTKPKCMYESCIKVAFWAPQGCDNIGNSTHCQKHKENGMINMRHEIKNQSLKKRKLEDTTSITNDENKEQEGEAKVGEAKGSETKVGETKVGDDAGNSTASAPQVSALFTGGPAGMHVATSSGDPASQNQPATLTAM